jgi:hypothetical protein
MDLDKRISHAGYCILDGMMSPSRETPLHKPNQHEFTPAWRTLAISAIVVGKFDDLVKTSSDPNSIALSLSHLIGPLNFYWMIKFCSFTTNMNNYIVS